MAKRGWRPRSSSATRMPRCRSTSASIVPAKPDADDRRRRRRRGGRGAASRRRHLAAHVAGERRRRALHRDWLRISRACLAPRAARAARRTARGPTCRRRPRGAGAGRAPARAGRRARSIVEQTRRREASRGCERLHRAVAGARRNQRDRRRAAVEGDVHRARQPVRPARPRGTNGGWISRKTRRSTSCEASDARPRRTTPTVMPLLRRSRAVGMRGFEAHRHFERVRPRRAQLEPLAQAPRAIADQRRMRLDDDARERRDGTRRSRRRRRAGRRAGRRSCRRCTA